MKKQIFLTLTMVALLVCAFAISAYAAECIDGIYYTFSGTEATVSGDNQKNCELETVVIPEKVKSGDTEYTVTAIASKAFGSQNKQGGNSRVKSVTVPSTVKSVGEYAFGNCPNITEVYCKSEKIGSRMFIDCNILETLTLENTVEIGGNAFNRTIITSVVIPSTVTKVGDYAFKECTSLTKVVILGKIIGPYMFHGCSSLNTLVLTDEIEAFGAECFGNKTYGAFTTFYTGNDCDSIKELGNYTSRFSSAKCYSYSDYIENNYTDTYKLIYDTNLCVAAFDGIHTEPEDDGDCTTALTCSVCADYTYKEAKEHANSETVTYLSFLQEGEYYIGCTNDGCTNGTTKKLGALFTCLGYSAPEYAEGGIAVGFMVDDKAIAEYETVTGKAVRYGVFAVSREKLGANEVFGEDGAASEGVVSANMTAYETVAFELKIVGFTDEQKDTKLAMGAYVAISDDEATEYSYMQDDTKGEKAGNYYFVSYNNIVEKH